DRLPDWWKILNGFSTTNLTVASSASTNSFAHGLTNLQVYQNPSVVISNNYSTLNDGLADWWKVKAGFGLSNTNVVGFVSGLVGWWKLDEGSGTNVYDYSLNGFDGVLAGSPLPQWTNGVNPYALAFNSTNKVQVGGASLLMPTNQ